MKELPTTILSKLKNEYQLTDSHILNLIHFVEILKKWSSTYNLIGPNEMDQIWERHILDSVQLCNHLPNRNSSPVIVDYGSGAGFPGLILSLIGYNNVHLVEKSQKKCLFLENVSRETEIKFKIHNSRIEDLPSNLKADIITSRALADLKSLLKYSKSILSDSGYCLFLKGEKVDLEIFKAKQNYNFNFEKLTGISKSTNVILKIWSITSK